MVVLEVLRKVLLVGLGVVVVVVAVVAVVHRSRRDGGGGEGGGRGSIARGQVEGRDGGKPLSLCVGAIHRLTHFPLSVALYTRICTCTAVVVLVVVVVVLVLVVVGVVAHHGHCGYGHIDA